MSDVPAVSASSLPDTYATNVLSLKLGSTRYLLRPGIAGRTDADAVPPASISRFPMHIVSAWNPEGMPATFEQNELKHARLEVAVAKTTHHAMPVTLIGSNSHWYEHAMAISGLTDKQAIALGKRYKQAAVIRIDREGWHILSTDMHEDFTDTVTLGWRLEVRTTPTCAMRALDTDGEQCKMHGGPFGSAAISAAVRWVQQRRVAIALLGCEHCETRATGVSEQGLLLNPNKQWCVASRHGGVIVRDKTPRKYFIQASVIGEPYEAE